MVIGGSGFQVFELLLLKCCILSFSFFFFFFFGGGGGLYVLVAFPDVFLQCIPLTIILVRRPGNIFRALFLFGLRVACFLPFGLFVFGALHLVLFGMSASCFGDLALSSC